jgi:hypothetical protein
MPFACCLVHDGGCSWSTGWTEGAWWLWGASGVVKVCDIMSRTSKKTFMVVIRKPFSYIAGSSIEVTISILT